MSLNSSNHAVFESARRLSSAALTTRVNFSASLWQSVTGSLFHALLYLFFRYFDGELPYFLTNERKKVE